MAVTGFNVFWHLSTTAISSMDEARYGVSASEMSSAHEYLVPTYAGRTEYWNLKPPLGYWLIEASYALFGRTPWALRWISAVCALGVVALTIDFCSRRFGRGAAILAGLMVATCFGFLSNHGARSGDLDAALTLIVTLALMQVPRLRDSSRRRLYFGALWACGFLLKSFAILPFALAAMIGLRWSEGGRLSWRAWLPAATVFAGTVGGWAMMRTIHDGTTAFVTRMIYEDLFMRSTHVIDQGSYAPLGYVGALFSDRFAPWPIFAVLGWCVRPREGSSRRRADDRRLLLAWTLVPLCLFSLVRTQHHWYLDPTYPAWAMLAASGLCRVLRNMRSDAKRVALVGAVLLALIGCELRLVARVAIRDRMPASQLFLFSLGARRLAPGEPLYAAFPLSNAERFLLQVVDGFDVRDASGATSAAIPTTGLVLGNGRWKPALSHQPCKTTAIVAQSDDYWLAEGQRPGCLADSRITEHHH